MLAALTVRDIVLIEQAALEFAPGLNVLTGETGAGKSILLDSLGLAVGNRGRATVRPGAAQGSATAIFDPAGLAGLLYWYMLYPLHRWIFGGMLNEIAAVAGRRTGTSFLVA